MEGYKNKLVYTDDVLSVIDRMTNTMKQDPKMQAYADRSEDLRTAVEGVLSLTAEQKMFICQPSRPNVLILCDTHKVGFLDTGMFGRELDSDQFLEEVQRDPYMVRKYFRRYRRCPDCGTLIQWDEVDV